MKPTTILYLKTFLIIGLTYGLLMLGFDLLIGVDIRIVKVLLTSLFFGSVMSLSLVSFHIHSLKAFGVQEMTKENLGVHQKRNLKSNLNLTELIIKLKADPVIKRMNMTDTANGILLDTGKSWNWWTEKIEILLNSGHDSNFEYQVSSKPKLNLALFAYGKNLENINRIEKAINSIA